MKKLLTLTLALSLVLLAGCSGSSSSAPAPSQSASSAGASVSAPAEKANLVVVTGDSGGTLYFMGTGMAKIVTEKVPGYSMTNEATSGSGPENCTLVSERLDTFGCLNMDSFNAGYNGLQDRGFRQALPDLRLALVGHVQMLYAVVHKDSGIETFADLRGKGIALPPAGQTAHYQARAILKAYGMEESDYRGTPMSYAESADALKDGTVVCAIVSGSIPQASVVDLNTTKDIRILSLDEEHRAAIIAEYPTWATPTIPGGTYSDQETDVTTTAINCCLLANANMDSEIVYNVVKAICENTDMMQEIHVNGGEWCADTTKPYFENPPLPFHEGAAKYYTELWG
jgi:TRAP transporter TAXI family solute receptor